MTRQMAFSKWSEGSAITEYGLAIALIGLIGIAALIGLGDSVSRLFTGTSSTLSGLTSLVPSFTNNKAAGPGLDFNATGTTSGQGHYYMAVDPDTGIPTLQLSDSGSAPNNASSIEGTAMTTFGSMEHAISLAELAKSERNPAYASYYEEIAKLSYYLGASEGRLDRLPEFQFSKDYFEPDDALVDLLNKKEALGELLRNPPAGI